MGPYFSKRFRSPALSSRLKSLSTFDFGAYPGIQYIAGLYKKLTSPGAITLNFIRDKCTSIQYYGFMMGNRLKEVLEGEGVTAYRLWKDLGIDQGQLSKFFSRKVNISLELLERIADYLNYDVVLVKRQRPKKGGK